MGLLTGYKERLAELLNQSLARREQPGYWERVGACLSQVVHRHMRPFFLRKAGQWGLSAEDVEDLAQQVCLAFLAAARAGRIRPDEATGRFTADVVGRYLHRIGVHKLADLSQHQTRHKQVFPPAEHSGAGETADGGASDPHLQLLERLPDSSAEQLEADSRLWQLLREVGANCRAQDVILTYLMLSGISPAVINGVLGTSINTPRNAVNRVVAELRQLWGVKTTKEAPHG